MGQYQRDECSSLSHAALSIHQWRLHLILLCCAVFGVFAVFVLPKLKVDPEEYRELVDQAKGLTSGSQPAQPQVLMRFMFVVFAEWMEG